MSDKQSHSPAIGDPSTTQESPSGRPARPWPERYEVKGELGQGGMAIVYRARDAQLGREVAVKVLHDFLARQKDARHRFHREATAVASLRHRGIVEIYDYSGPETEPAYIVTELIEGDTLRARLEGNKRVPLPELGALVALEVVRAVRNAHEQGILHRDIKPENVMVTLSGQPKLMDFGIAQVIGGATRLTATGTLLGSPAHMAPEVIDGKPSDHRADIFSLGTLLYWLCTGKLPFEAPNPSALFRRILEGDFDPPQMHEPKMGNGLARIIAKSLDPDPANRFQDVSELEAELAREVEEVGMSASEAEVKAFLRDPEPFVEALRPKLVDHLVTAGKTALENKSVGKAMDCFNRVLAVDPDHPEVSALVSKVARRARVRERGRKILLLAAALLVTVGAAGAWAMWGPDDRRGDTSGNEGDVTPPVAALAAVDVPTTKPVVEPEEKGAATTATIAKIPKVATKPIKITKLRPKRSLRKSAAKSVENRRILRLAQEPGTPPSTADAGLAPSTRFRIVLNAWAHILLDGRVVKREVLKAELSLDPGMHEIVVFRPNGRLRPRKLEVTETGEIYEHGARGRTRLARPELRLRLPRPGDENNFDGWTSTDSGAGPGASPKRPALPSQP